MCGGTGRRRPVASRCSPFSEAVSSFAGATCTPWTWSPGRAALQVPAGGGRYLKYRPPLGPRQTSDRPLAVQIWRDSHGQGLGHRLAAPGELGGAVLEAGWWQRDAAAVPGLSADSAGRRRGRPRRFIVREELARSSAGLGSSKEMAAGLGVCGADRRRRRPCVPVDGRVQPSCIAHELILDVEAGGEWRPARRTVSASRTSSQTGRPARRRSGEPRHAAEAASRPQTRGGR